MIRLPFPHAALAGHNKGNWHGKKRLVADHRDWARIATLGVKPTVPEKGDILVKIAFYPANKRGDRVNFPNRMKPYFDGIADALKVNDSRFLPAFEYHEPDKGYPRVEVYLGDAESGLLVNSCCAGSCPINGLPL